LFALSWHRITAGGGESPFCEIEIFNFVIEVIPLWEKMYCLPQVAIAKNGLNSSPFFTKQLGFTAHLLLRLFRSLYMVRFVELCGLPMRCAQVF
jgi:hypothetical protein